MAWADKAKLCVDWHPEDQERLAELRTWLNSEREEVVRDLAQRLIELNGAQLLVKNVRFTRRLHSVIRDWLTGLVQDPFQNGRTERRRALGRSLADVDLSFEDVLVLESVTRQRLSVLAQQHIGETDRALFLTIHTLNKAIRYDRGLIYAGCLDLHDAQLEQALLDHFLTVTGFSPTLYESLAEAWRWNQERLGHRQVSTGLSPSQM